MKEERINRIAALLSGNLSEPEKDRLLEEIAKDDEELRLLAALELPPVEEDQSIQEFPFPISSLIRLGIHKSCLKVLELEGSTLENEFQRIALAASRITNGALPFCVEGRLDLRFETPSAMGELQVDSDPCDTDAFRLEVRPDDEAFQSRYMEVWRDGRLQSACPGEMVSKEPMQCLPSSGVWALKPSDSPFGLGFRIRPVEFQFKDWLSVCLSCALMGRFSEAKSVLEERLQPIVGEWTRHKNILGILECLKSVASVKQGVLVPLPATRSVPTDAETRKAVFQSVWNGILACWPQARRMPNPWSEPTEEGEEPTESVADLVRATIQAVTDPGPLKPGDLDTDDPLIRAGWAALLGWEAILDEDPRKGLEAFSSVAPTATDPFGLGAASAFTKHLMKSKVSSESDPGYLESSDQVMREVFKTLLESRPNGIESAP